MITLIVKEEKGLSDLYSIAILENGIVVGRIEVNVEDPEVIDIEYMEIRSSVNVRNIFKKIKERFPEAIKVSGIRISGARESREDVDLTEIDLGRF